MKPLTKKQRQLYDFIVKFIAINGYAPSYQELCKSGLIGKYVSTAWRYVQMLQHKGWLKHKKNKSRWIVILK